MKAQILKIAGVKNEKDFYKKFPTEAAFMKKHGKELKKAVNGFEGLIKPPAMPKVNPVNLAKTQGFGLSKLEDIPASTDRGFDYAGAFKEMPGAIGSQLGTLIGAFQDIKQNKKDLKKQQMYGKVSDVTLQAASSRAEQPQRRYVRPEDQLLENFRPLGTGTNYLAAANGATIGGNPTEIQNMYGTPDTMYTDLGYEPLTDNSKVKNFKKGGKLKKGVAGLSLNSFSGQGGSLGGMLGSAIGGGSGQGGPGSTIGSAIGGVLGMAIPIPGVGSFIGSTLGGLAGGLFDAPGQKKKKEAEEKLQGNLQAAAFQSGVQGLQEQNSSFMKDGGWVSNDWMPQTITKFGEYNVKDLLKPPHDADMLRAGGHLREYTPPSAAAMYTGRDLPYQMENGGQMAMGGDLQVHRGEAETMSYNPYLPDGGETVMFRGPSHDDGGMPISFGQNGVEVEGGEPAIKMQDGGKEGNLVVYGNMIIPDYGVNEINDPKAKGKKFKHYIADLSKQEAKINKSVEKGVELVNTKDSGDPFDQLAFNSGKAMMMGGDAKLKTIAERKMDAAAVQNAILDTAEEYGVKSDELAKGRIKMDKDNNMYAEFGKKIMFDKGGKTGKKYDAEFENFINQAMQLEQANSFQAGDYRGGGSNFGTNNPAIKTPEQAKEFYYKNYWSKVKDLPAGLRTRALQMAINTGDPYGELMVAAGKMGIDERRDTKGQRKDKDIKGNKAWESSKADILKEYNEDPEGFLAKLDSEQNRYYDSLVKANTKDGKAFGSINPDTAREFYDDYMGLARNASQQYIPREKVAEAMQAPQQVTQQPIAQVAQQPVSATAPTDGLRVNVGLTPIAEASPSAYIPNLNKQISEARALESARNTTELDEVKVVAPKLRLDTNLASLPFRQSTSNFQLPDVTMPSLDTEEDVTADEQRKKRFSFDNDLLKLGAIAATSALGQFRPSDVESLDPAQLAPEMMSLATNTLEPVQAQTFQPLLSAPTSYSLQDQLNEITSQTRAAERMSAYNPEAASMIAAQAYNAKNKVLGEQFRMNQAEQQRVMEQNRNVLNDAQLKNLAIFDTQYTRQEQAKSATKQQALEAMKSIADKTAKNKLENRQLGVMENLYNYRFNRDGQAYNLNNPQFFNYNGGVDATGNALGKMPNGMLPDYDTDETTGKPKLVGYKLPKETKSTKRNGAIVKAIKDL
jgi:hypothetical protein